MDEPVVAISNCKNIGSLGLWHLAGARLTSPLGTFSLGNRGAGAISGSRASPFVTPPVILGLLRFSLVSDSFPATLTPVLVLRRMVVSAVVTVASTGTDAD